MGPLFSFLLRAEVGAFHEGNQLTIAQAGTLMSQLFRHHHSLISRSTYSKRSPGFLNIKPVLLAALPYLESPQFQ